MAMGVTLSLHLHKGICHVSHPEQVVTASLALFGMQQEDSICAQKYCTEAAVTTLPDIPFILFAMTVSFSETSCFKLLMLMSVRRKANCAGTLVEVILDCQSKIPSKQPNFTLTCDSCDCGFLSSWPAVSVSLSVAAGALFFLFSSLCLSLCLCMPLCLSKFS